MEDNTKKNVQAFEKSGTSELQSYEEMFLQNDSMKKRGDKSIYVRPEFHERLSRIAYVIGGDKIPLYAYLDNILVKHFEMFKQEIIRDYNSKIKPIF